MGLPDYDIDISIITVQNLKTVYSDFLPDSGQTQEIIEKLKARGGAVRLAD